jgi:hypothetical protein
MLGVLRVMRGWYDVGVIQMKAIMAVDWPRPSVFGLAALLAWESRDDGEFSFMQSWGARTLGTSRDTMSRTMAALMEARIITGHGRSRYAWNPEALADLRAFVARIPDNSRRAVPDRDDDGRLTYPDGVAPANATGGQLARVQRPTPEPATPPATPRPGRPTPAQLDTARRLGAAANRHGSDNVRLSDGAIILDNGHDDADDCGDLDGVHPDDREPVGIPID